MSDTESFVEDFALWLEDFYRVPRMAGRVLGHLLITPSEAFTQGELCASLDASAGAVSVALKTLVNDGFVERMSQRGSRTISYRLREGVWALDHLRRGQEATRRMLGIAERGVRAVGDDPHARTELTRLSDYFAFWDAEYDRLIAKYMTTRGAVHAPASATRRRRAAPQQ